MVRTTSYSPEFKDQLLAKVFSPGAPKTMELAKQANIPYNTLHTWIHKHKKIVGTKQHGHDSIREITAEAKLQAIVDTSTMTELELNAYCRKQGIFAEHLSEWKKQIMTQFTSNKRQSAEDKKYQAELKVLAAENKQLKRELRHKEKALAEASALLILKKKAALLLGEDAGD